MTQLTDHGPSLSSRGYSAARDTSAVGQAFFSGVVAACLGLGTLAVVVVLLWIGSPYAGTGPSGALHVAADLWLLAHGAELARAQPAVGGTAPIGLNPLLISALPCWLLHRAARHALEPPEPVPGGAALSAPPVVLALSSPPLVPRRAVAWVAGGYLLVGLAAVVYASEGPVRVEPLGALLRLPVVTVTVVAMGVWSGTGRPYGLLPTAVRRLLTTLPLPGAARLAEALHAPAWLTPRRLATALRATGAAVLALIGTGALLTAVSLTGHAGAVSATFGQLTGAWSGRLAVLVLSLALLPNAVLWAGVYGLGPGFTIGAGSTVAPLGMTGYPELPYFPLLAALPGESPRGGLPYLLLAATVPLAVGLSVAWFVSSAALRPLPTARIPHTRGEAMEPPLREVPAPGPQGGTAPAPGTPADERPGGETPADERPFPETPAGEEPFPETPAGEEPAREAPSGEEPARGRPAGEGPVGGRGRGGGPGGGVPCRESPVGESPAGVGPAHGVPRPGGPCLRRTGRGGARPGGSGRRGAGRGGDGR
ncbi:hypothetical protein IHE55_17640 [Streptomyces pactum]|uniref:Integral membrane protein n=1 Tax=Streptomyces pactum TaxID=68249 RepID=A0ABS0NN32_9ACTN|nr:DUF6350 family protein [Streptomyces pactum]MBH5336497.1 hypothetical protein [Streptomyces pactum]